MAFFARPNLDNVQFKQLDGSVLTLSGQTQIATTSGLTLYGGMSGGTPYYIPIIATNADNFDVLTYCNGIISLQPSSASGGTGIYDGLSPTTCSIGGLSAGTTIYGSGYTDILQCMLVPTLYPTLVNPSISCLTIIPSTTLYEIGSTPSLCACTCFYPGSINPQYTAACSCRSNGTTCYSYDVFGVPCFCQQAGNSPNNLMSFGALTINNPSQSISATVYYCCGTQPYDSAANTYCAPLPSGLTNCCITGCQATKTISGIYPVYYGKLTSGTRPAVTNALVTGGTKVVTTSTGTVTVDFDSVSQYTWLAIPATSCSRTCWYVNASNNGCIGSSASDKYPDECVLSITGGTGSNWADVNYKVYMSKVNWSDPDPIQFRCN